MISNGTFDFPEGAPRRTVYRVYCSTKETKQISPYIMASETAHSSITMLDVGSVGVSTPFSKGDKRKASSPLDAADADSKKSRLHSDGSNVSPMDDADEAAPVHLLSQPMNPLDIVSIASELRSLMMPEMANIMKGQLPDIRAIVNESTETLSSEIQTLRVENAKLRDENDKLRNDVRSLTTRVAKVETENDALEQYTRRNSVRISGVPETEGENTDEFVFRLAGALQSYIGPSDIDRSHRVGKPKTGGRHRDIIVKFATYGARQRIYLKRMDLRESENGDMKTVFINEDLTKIRSKLLFDARTLVKGDKLKSAYSADGKIFVRDNSDDRYLIKTKADLLKYGDPDETRKVLTERAKTRGSGAIASA